MAIPVTFSEYPVGAALGPVRLDITAEMAERFAAAVGSDGSWYAGLSPFGGRIAPYTAVEQVMLITLGDTYRVSDAPGGSVQYRLDIAYHRPPLVDTSVEIRGHTLEKTERPGRYQSSFAFEVVDAAHGALLFDGSVAQAHLLGGGGGSRPKGEARKPETRQEEPGEPYEALEPMNFTLTLEMMRLYAAWPELARFGRSLENQHTSAEEAARLGRPGVIAMGAHLVAYLEEYMLRRFGEEWLTGSRLQVTFVGMVLEGDEVTIEGRLRSSGPQDANVTVDLTCRTGRGSVAVVGSASLSRSRSTGDR